MVSDPVLAERSWISGGQFNDIDAQAAQFHGYGQQYEQLSRGPFEGRFRSFNFGDGLSIHFETANRALAQSAATPPGRYAACVLGEASPVCTLNARTLSPNQVALCPETKSLEGTTSEGMSIICMDVSNALLPDGGQEIRTTRILSDPSRARCLRELLKSGINAFTALESPSGYPAAVTGFQSSLAELLWEMATQPDHEQVRKLHHHTTTRVLQVFRRAREYIHHCLQDGISITTLCTDLGVSRRSLEYVFQSVVGMGPANYVRAVQLNHIRRDLMSDASADVSIGVIAARRGVWHWSRFSRHYRLLFGELPSQTRSRSSQLATRYTGLIGRRPTDMVQHGWRVEKCT
jgi:AraC family ethanolamine operon transcriptional activator